MSEPPADPRPGGDARSLFQAWMDGCPVGMAELLAALEEIQLTDEAELAAQGIRPVSVVHGDMETSVDEELIGKALPRLAREAGPFSSTRGGNDYTTWYFSGPQAGQSAVRFIASATAIARRWWIITPTAQPQFRR
jgi:hypothetical protein